MGIDTWHEAGWRDDLAHWQGEEDDCLRGEGIPWIGSHAIGGEWVPYLASPGPSGTDIHHPPLPAKPPLKTKASQYTNDLSPCDVEVARDRVTMSRPGISATNPPDISKMHGSVHMVKRGLDPWHKDAFPPGLGQSGTGGDRGEGWFLFDWCGNAIGFVLDDEEGSPCPGSYKPSLEAIKATSVPFHDKILSLPREVGYEEGEIT